MVKQVTTDTTRQLFMHVHDFLSRDPFLLQPNLTVRVLKKKHAVQVKSLLKNKNNSRKINYFYYIQQRYLVLCIRKH